MLLGIRAALQGPARGQAAGTAKSFQDTIDITIPRWVKAEDINKYSELAFWDTFEPLSKTAEGKVSRACTRKTADAVHKGVVSRGEEIKAHTKRKREANINDEEASGEEGHKTSAGATQAAVGDAGLSGLMVEMARLPRTEPRSGSWAATGAERIMGGLCAMRWAPSARKRGAPAAARKDTLPKCVPRQPWPGQPSSGIMASRWSLRSDETKTLAPREGCHDTATVTGNTEEAAGRERILSGRNPEAMTAAGAGGGAETAAATRAETRAGTRAKAAAGSAAGAAGGVVNRRCRGAETRGAAGAEAVAETVDPRPVTVARQGHMSPRAPPPPPTLAPQWQGGLLPPPEDWQRLTGGQAWWPGPTPPMHGGLPPTWNPMPPGRQLQGPLTPTSRSPLGRVPPRHKDVV